MNFPRLRPVLAVFLSLGFPAFSATLYVDLNSPGPVAPYSDWSTAATNIQDAVDAAGIGDIVLVTNGVYSSGGRPANGASVTNRLLVDKAIAVRSVNGPSVTIVRGNPVIGGAAVRGVYLTNGAALVGFTITNCATRQSGDVIKDESGGGIWCAVTNGIVVSNCVIVANGAMAFGGGVYQGTLYNCVLVNNYLPPEGGAFTSPGAGGGACQSTLYNCVIRQNRLLENMMTGGGTYNCKVFGSAIYDNFGAREGGGAYGGMLVNCTITRNTAEDCGGVAYANLTNCIVYYNRATNSIEDTAGHTVQSNLFGGVIRYCCTWSTYYPSSFYAPNHNFTNEPVLSGMEHQALSSPCIGAGVA
ncbi:MAG TPA: hypothetical protein VN625_03665, partial [Desulfuromonadaceae bacterium]|nr:hypothetical protein [Desulfuromonadaceae bacterium]